MVKDSDRNGIIAGGNWIIDHVKIIDTYPSEERLTNIQDELTSSGGAPFNVLMALHKIGVDIPLEGIGLVGNDENGRIILDECKEMAINTDQVKMLNGVPTSYTDVMTVGSTGKRTFFHCRGANAHLTESQFDFSSTQSSIFHLGYLLLLDGLDSMDSEGMTGAARVLRQASKAGLMTSVDVVSEQSDRYKIIIPPSLPYVDVLFVNEFEMEMLTGIDILDDQGYLVIEKVRVSIEMIFELGVRQWIIVHFAKGAYAAHTSGKQIFQPGINVSKDFIKGSVGAGDAFAAGVLEGIHNNRKMEDSLISGICVAVSSLQEVTSTGGIRNLEECLEFGSIFEWQS